MFLLRIIKLKHCWEKKKKGNSIFYFYFKIFINYIPVSAETLLARMSREEVSEQVITMNVGGAWRKQRASDLGSAVCSSQLQSAQVSVQVLFARLARVKGVGGRQRRGGRGWRGRGNGAANTSPRRFTAMRYSYLCLIDCIGGGSSTMCRPFQRATLAPLFSFFHGSGFMNYVSLYDYRCRFRIPAVSIDSFLLSFVFILLINLCNYRSNQEAY